MLGTYYYCIILHIISLCTILTYNVCVLCYYLFLLHLFIAVCIKR